MGKEPESIDKSCEDDKIMYEFLIRDCDENGFPQIEECSRCKKNVPRLKLNLHMRRCKKEKLS